MPPIDILFSSQGRRYGGIFQQSDPTKSRKERREVCIISGAADPDTPRLGPTLISRVLSTWRSRGPTLRRYSAGFVFDAFKLAFYVLVGAQAIFLSNVVVADLLPDVMEHQAGVGKLFALIILTVPGVMVIALPLAVLVGSYLVLMNRRALGEFASFAGIGFSSRALLTLAFVIGAGAVLVSHVVSGYAEPVSRYQLAKTIFTIKNDAVREGRIASGEFNSVGDYEVYAQAGRFNGAAQGLFIHERIDDGTARVITAERSFRVREEEDPGLGLILRSVAVYRFEAGEEATIGGQVCSGCREDSAEIILSDQMYVQFRTPETSQLRVRGSHVADWTNFELLRLGNDHAEASATLSERLLRDILCMLAPFVALLAATLTTSRTYLFALPIAGGLVLAAQFLGTFAAKSFVAVGLIPMLATVVALAALVGVALMVMIRQREAGLLQPLDLQF